MHFLVSLKIKMDFDGGVIFNVFPLGYGRLYVLIPGII
jgi:hypothetical protein